MSEHHFRGMVGPPEPGLFLRARLFVHGQPVREEMLGPGVDLEAVGDSMGEDALAAERAGLAWQLVVEDPDGQLPTFRQGTDPAGMVDPRPATPAALEEWLRRADPRARS